MSRRSVTPVATLALTVLVGGLAGCSGGGGKAVDVTPTTSTSSTSSADPAPSEDAATQSPAPSASDVSVGGVVAGFPADLLPLPEGAEPLLTSAVPTGDKLQVSLSGRTTAPPESVLDTYRASLTAAGFAESPSAGAPGALASTFTRGDGAELVSVAVVPDGASSTFTVGGTVAPPAP